MRAIKEYKVISSGIGITRLRGTNQQTDDGLLHVVPSIISGGTSIKTLGLSLASFRIYNHTAAQDVGIGVRIPNHLWRAGQWDDSAAPAAFTDDTTDAQDTGANDFPLETTTANDGYVIASKVPFNAVSINVGTASVGTPARAARLSNTAGSGWTDFGGPGAPDWVFDGKAANYTTEENLLIFALSPAWGQTQVGGLDGVPGGYYALNVRATTAPTTAGVATAIEIFRLYWFEQALPSKATVRADYSPAELAMPHGDALVAFFNTPDSKNVLQALVRNGIN